MTYGDIRVSSVLKDLAALVGSGTGLDNTAESVVSLARDNLECDYAGITIGHRNGRLESLAVTDPVVEKADRLQYDLREGPCVAALWEQDSFAAEEIAEDARWPTWGPAAAELGLRSLLATRMTTSGHYVGALNLYSARSRTFTADDVSFAHVFAQQAAVALRNARRLEQLQVAIDGRTLIGQAQGILMERFTLTSEQAFAVLRRVSQDSNLKLHAIAAELIRTGRLHEPPPSTKR